MPVLELRNMAESCCEAKVCIPAFVDFSRISKASQFFDAPSSLQQTKRRQFSLVV